ncbi:hypothetical protein [Dyadobacter sandarakinus]|uniref:Uncharacterized protein n=1 Tax=Dyadobacter sandarakinus TaxID=2747268 RepID=A0ABX7I1G7_9BACT|nr:hypothetical protein [Dyadobacter sandarakinus]QRQ99707.1 hypothetical protein HWI92_01645 [Dyadobacter sandarakinus]
MESDFEPVAIIECGSVDRASEAYVVFKWVGEELCRKIGQSVTVRLASVDRGWGCEFILPDFENATYSTTYSPIYVKQALTDFALRKDFVYSLAGKLRYAMR